MHPHRSTHAPAAAGVALLLCACSHRSKGPDGLPLWIEVQSEHFVLRAATDEVSARAAAVKLEEIRRAIRAASWHAKTELPGKVQVVLLEDNSRLPPGFAGVTTQDALGAAFIALAPEDDLSEVPVLKHELAHAVQQQFLLRSPLWLTEGLAVYVQTLKLESGGATLGLVSLPELRAARAGPLAFGELFTAGPEVYLGSDVARERFYSRAWLMVHLLANRHADKLDAYLQRLGNAEDPQAAYAACCAELSAAVLEKDANEFFTKGAYSVHKVRLPPVHTPVQSRTMRTAEVRATLAQVAVASSRGGQPALRAQAERQARDALALDPGEPLAVLALCDATTVHSDACAAAARELTRLQTDDARGFLLLALSLQIQHGPEWTAVAARAAELAPGEPLALVSLADLRLQQNRLGEALDAAVKASKLAPGRPMPLDAVATVLAAAGKCDDAMMMERRVLEVLPDYATPETARSVRARIDELGRRCAEGNRARSPIAQARRLSCASGGPRMPRSPGIKPGTRVTIHYKILPDGKPAELVVDKGTPAELARPLVDYVKSCKFEPARRGDQAIESEVEEYFSYYEEKR